MYLCIPDQVHVWLTRTDPRRGQLAIHYVELALAIAVALQLAIALAIGVR